MRLGRVYHFLLDRMDAELSAHEERLGFGARDPSMALRKTAVPGVLANDLGLEVLYSSRNRDHWSCTRESCRKPGAVPRRRSSIPLDFYSNMDMTAHAFISVTRATWALRPWSNVQSKAVHH